MLLPYSEVLYTSTKGKSKKLFIYRHRKISEMISPLVYQQGSKQCREYATTSVKKTKGEGIMPYVCVSVCARACIRVHTHMESRQKEPIIPVAFWESDIELGAWTAGVSMKLEEK